MSPVYILINPTIGQSLNYHRAWRPSRIRIRASLAGPAERLVNPYGLPDKDLSDPDLLLQPFLVKAVWHSPVVDINII